LWVGRGESAGTSNTEMSEYNTDAAHRDKDTTTAKYHLVYWLNWIIRTSRMQIIFKWVHLNLDV